MAETIRTQIILEVLGKPAEYVREVAEKLVEQLKQEKNIRVQSAVPSDVKEIEQSKGFFTMFADVEFEADSVLEIMGICFRYMPAHIEIITPQSLTLRNNELNEFFNGLLTRLHAYDEIAKVLQIQNQQRQNELEAMKMHGGNDENNDEDNIKKEN
jgi:hypothetical protein